MVVPPSNKSLIKVGVAVMAAMTIADDPIRRATNPVPTTRAHEGIWEEARKRAQSGDGW